MYFKIIIMETGSWSIAQAALGRTAILSSCLILLGAEIRGVYTLHPAVYFLY